MKYRTFPLEARYRILSPAIYSYYTKTEGIAFEVIKRLRFTNYFHNILVIVAIKIVLSPPSNPIWKPANEKSLGDNSSETFSFLEQNRDCRDQLNRRCFGAKLNLQNKTCN